MTIRWMSRNSARFLLFALLSMTLAVPAIAAPVLFSGSLVRSGPGGTPSVAGDVDGAAPTPNAPGFLQIAGSTANAPFTVPASTFIIDRTRTTSFPSYPFFFSSIRRPLLVGAFSVGGGGVTATTTVLPNTTVFPNFSLSPRQGSLRLVPGPNMFGGTARHIHDDYYMGLRLGSVGTYDFRIFANSNSVVGGPLGGNEHLTTGTRTHRTLTSGGSAMGPLIGHSPAARSGAPWITGMVTAKAPAGYYVSTLTATGTNMRTSMGQSGSISLVTPALLHGFVSGGADPANILAQAGGFAYRTTLSLQFAPEPAQAMMLGVGILGLLGMIHHRRSSRTS